ncbi:hypothetical protein ACJEC8_00050 [Candidatus Carsonella ruddii]
MNKKNYLLIIKKINKKNNIIIFFKNYKFIYNNFFYLSYDNFIYFK